LPLPLPRSSTPAGDGSEDEEGQEEEEEEGADDEEEDEEAAGRDPEAAAAARAEVQRLLEEYFKLDYEDVVGGIPTRFR
jgi:protein KRI1